MTIEHVAFACQGHLADSMADARSVVFLPWKKTKRTGLVFNFLQEYLFDEIEKRATSLPYLNSSHRLEFIKDPLLFSRRNSRKEFQNKVIPLPSTHMRIPSCLLDDWVLSLDDTKLSLNYRRRSVILMALFLTTKGGHL